ncbi:MAG: hypothetical protein COT73_04110 [Bdellovibrio sp. CG10_big_fil_rev_8_21_14_0_10_47_8]|nr:MAG: hypothetical protein COT73_04110 [Bdellovibrio sp. CG10_big_fil_rev_8_21_14_0_10_47_8]
MAASSRSGSVGNIWRDMIKDLPNSKPMIKNEYRADIDGLRALAVMSVVLYHLDYSWFGGGFVGVDVFFVISGFLITQLVRREILQQKFSFWTFYERRARRLLPALFAILGLTSIGSFWLLSPEHFMRFGGSVLSSLFSVSNIYFWKESGYFDTESVFKPLLHTWSLSVEEQFYFVWPLSLVLLYRLRHRHVPLGIFILGTASLGLNYFYLNSPDTIFFLMPFRVFEFAIGAGLVWAIAFRPPQKFWMEAFTLLGLGFILFSVFSYTRKIAFPSSAALMPCVGTALIIYSAQASKLGLFFRNQFMTGLGKISYSLYLVHWPLIVLYKYWKFDDLTNSEKIGLAIASILIAGAMYFLVEQPFRAKTDHYLISRRRFAFLISFAFLSLSYFGARSWRNEYRDQRKDMNKPSEAFHRSMNLPTCLDNFGLCPQSRRAPDIALIGDSHSNATYLYATIAARTHKTIRAYSGMPACFALYNNTLECQAEMNRRIQEVINDHIDTVFLISNWNPFTHQYEPRWIFEKLAETIQLLQKNHVQVYVWGSMPFMKRDPATCYNRPFVKHCPDILLPDQYEVQKKFNLDLKTVVHNNNARYFDLFQEICPNDICSAATENISLYRDRYHLDERSFGALIYQTHQIENQPMTFNQIYR